MASIVKTTTESKLVEGDSMAFEKKAEANPAIRIPKKNPVNCQVFPRIGSSPFSMASLLTWLILPRRMPLRNWPDAYVMMIMSVIAHTWRLAILTIWYTNRARAMSGKSERSAFVTLRLTTVGYSSDESVKRSPATDFTQGDDFAPATEDYPEPTLEKH